MVLPLQWKVGLRATHALGRVRSLIEAGRYYIALSASSDAWGFGFDEDDVLQCVSGLLETECYKTMESTKRPGSFQDVYHPTYCGIELYVKLVITDDARVHIVSFKVR
jgi:hypothetical protein